MEDVRFVRSVPLRLASVVFIAKQPSSADKGRSTSAVVAWRERHLKSLFGGKLNVKISSGQLNPDIGRRACVELGILVFTLAALFWKHFVNLDATVPL